jgi:uncharacterized membrane protein
MITNYRIISKTEDRTIFPEESVWPYSVTTVTYEVTRWFFWKQTITEDFVKEIICWTRMDGSSIPYELSEAISEFDSTAIIAEYGVPNKRNLASVRKQYEQWNKR